MPLPYDSMKKVPGVVGWRAWGGGENSPLQWCLMPLWTLLQVNSIKELITLVRQKAI